MKIGIIVGSVRQGRAASAVAQWVKSVAERTEDGFGQGKVVVSPFGMALAAAKR